MKNYSKLSIFELVVCLRKFFLIIIGVFISLPILSITKKINPTYQLTIAKEFLYAFNECFELSEEEKKYECASTLLDQVSTLLKLNENNLNAITLKYVHSQLKLANELISKHDWDQIKIFMKKIENR